MWLFGTQKKQPRPLDAFCRGCFLCRECGAQLPLARYYPLSMSPCIHCQAVNFVPMRVAGYWLIAPLGGGGMGSVYKAFHEHDDGTFYAVKVLPRQQVDNPALIANLQQEARVHQAVGRHRAIATCVEVGCDDGEHYLVSEFLEGERLDERIRRCGRIPPEELLPIGLRLLGALAHIHNRGYLYRDIKPENVIIVPAEGAVLYDFGISIPIEDALEDPGETVQGSPIFFPPERLTGEGEGPSSELYSLGMVLYDAATGHAYFTQKGVNTIASMHMRELRSSHRDRELREVWPDGAELILRLIARHPEERPQSFIEAEAQMTELLQHQPVALAVAN